MLYWVFDSAANKTVEYGDIQRKKYAVCCCLCEKIIAEQ